MKKIILMMTAITFLLIAIVYTVTHESKDLKDPEVQLGTDFPDGSNVPEESPLKLKTQFGEVLQVDNFLLNDNTVPDAQNTGYFYLGNTFPKTEYDSSPNYVITYIQETQFFNVTLLKEPLSSARLEAELYLKTVLGLSDVDMCKLQYTLSVPAYVNEEVSSSDLKFSFCKESVPL
jgi:hypothetical protein